MTAIRSIRHNPQWLPHIAEWHHETWRDLNPRETLEDRLAAMQRFLQPGLWPEMLVAGEETPLGTVSLVHQPGLAQNNWPWLTNVFVRPDMRRQGLGRRLVQSAQTWAFAHGVRGLYLLTPDRQNFYRKLGWRPVRRQWFKGRSMTLMSIANPGSVQTGYLRTQSPEGA
jgi:GNAT superfamily N-acetyltransferase